MTFSDKSTDLNTLISFSLHSVDSTGMVTTFTDLLNNFTGTLAVVPGLFKPIILEQIFSQEHVQSSACSVRAVSVFCTLWVKPTTVLQSISCKTTLIEDLTKPTWVSQKALKAFPLPSGKGVLLFSVDTAFKHPITFMPIMSGTISL